MRLALALAASLVAAPVSACEVALVLAIDVSGSVDPKEYRLQIDGLTDALADPTVEDALIETKAHLAVMQWSGASRQSVTTPWTAIETRSDIAALRRAIQASPRAYRHFSTAIGEALIAAANLHRQLGVTCGRRVIDVSGDGVSNEGADAPEMRDALVAQGFQINGLAIEIGQDGLEDYYRAEVIGGPGAFVLSAKGFEDYPRAIRRKLLREITRPVVRAPTQGAAGCLDSLAADKARAIGSCG